VRRSLKIAAIVAVVAGLCTLGLAEETVKVGFIYVGPIGDYGWSHAHNVAREICEQAFPWLETVYVESVPEGEVETYIDQLVRQGCDIVFTTSFGFMDGTYAAALRYPEVILAHCSGFMRAPNLATYMADFYQVYYLNGLMAGALTKSGKVAYVGAFPIPEVKRHISAFTIGVREANPNAEVHVRWIYEWFNPAAAKEAAEALVAEGCDVFAFTEDSPTVVQVAAEHGLPSFGHYSPMYDFAPDYVVSGQLVHWEAIYLDFLQKIQDGVYTNENLEHVDYWWLLSQKAVEVGARPGMMINPVFEDDLKAYIVDHPTFGNISVYDLVKTRQSQMADPGVTFDPFQGPVYDRQGILRVPEGMWMSVDALITMEWAVEGVVGPWPGEPTE
jgi:simple sugar transport system substrate-binding protein